MLRSRLSRVSGLIGLAVVLVACGQPGPAPGGSGADVLTDGLVTAAEYRATIDAVVACLHDKGWDTTEPKLQLDGVTLGVSINLPSGSEEEAVASTQAWDECFGERETKVQRQYFKQHVPTGAARDAMMAKLLGCLTAVGVTGLTPATSEQDIVGAIAEQSAQDMSPGLLCLEKYSLVFPEGKVDG